MGILTPLYNLPNNVLAKQKAYQNDARPLIMRGPRGRLYVLSFGALFGVGMIGTTMGIVQMIKGKSD